MLVASALPLLLLFLTSLATSQTTLIVTSTPTSTPPSPQYTNPPTLQSSVLNSTNTYRKQHNATALKWNDTLATYASQQVQKCVFQHSHGPYGENLAEGYADMTAVVDAWGDERAVYDFSENGGQGEGFSEQTGHFTQLVWKATTSTGCGARDCGGSGWLVFCEYYPPGNVAGEYGANVQQALPGSGVDDEGWLGRYVVFIHGKVSGGAGPVRGNRWESWAVVVVGLVLGLVLLG